MMYPKGQTPLHVPHWRQVRILSPSLTAYRLSRKVLLNVLLNGESVISKVHLRIGDVDAPNLRSSGIGALGYNYTGKDYLNTIALLIYCDILHKKSTLNVTR
jgi:hypothetical protein